MRNRVVETMFFCQNKDHGSFLFPLPYFLFLTIHFKLRLFKHANFVKYYQLLLYFLSNKKLTEKKV